MGKKPIVMETRRDTNRPSGMPTPKSSFVGPKHVTRIGFWNVRTMASPTKTTQVIKEMERYHLDILGISEMRWPEAGKRSAEKGQTRKSAVELLAASKAQFYNIRSSKELDKQQDLAVPSEQEQRICKSSRQKEPPRSKSEHDLPVLPLSKTEDDDEKYEAFVDNWSIEDVQRLNLEDSITIHHINKSDRDKRASLTYSASITSENEFNPTFTRCLSESSADKPHVTSLSEAETDHYEILLTQTNQISRDNTASAVKPPSVDDKVDGPVQKRPVPLPRKLKTRPVPQPRKLSAQTLVHKVSRDLELCPTEITSPPAQCSSSVQSAVTEIPGLHTHSLVSDLETDVREQHGNVESLTKRFTTLSATSPISEFDIFSKSSIENKSRDVKRQYSGTYGATKVQISKLDIQSCQGRQDFISDDTSSGCLTQNTTGAVETPLLNTDLTNNKNRKRCPDITTSRAIKRDRRSTNSDFISGVSGAVGSAISGPVSVEKSNSSTTTRSEMSFESADQAVCESEVSAIPAVSMESDSLRGENEGTREVTRSNSSLSGKVEQQSLSPLSISPTSHCSLVPRSHSDIGCRLGNQHSQISSLVFSHNRLSRTSVGADLENFFNQMGLEKGVLEHVHRFQELQPSEVFDSVSSLDSQDAVYSHSEQEWTDSQSSDRSQQQTSIVERNARIIKWLCNVRKAKSQPQVSESPAGSKA